MQTITLSSGGTITVGPALGLKNTIGFNISPEEASIIAFSALLSILPSEADKIIAEIVEAFKPIEGMDPSKARPLCLNSRGILPSPKN